LLSPSKKTGEMAKAAYAKNFRSVRAFCVLIKKERMRRDAVSFPFIFICLAVCLYLLVCAVL